MGLRTCPADDLYFQQSPRVLLYDFKKGRRGPVSNWSGPVWVLSSYYLAEGLSRYGFGALACWNDAGVGLWPPSGTFVSWNVLAPFMLDRFA